MNKRTHKCGECRKRFTTRVGTIFEDSKLPIRKWPLAIWLIASNKKGIASANLSEQIRVTLKTAWFITHRLHYAIRTQSFNRPLDYEVEADETFIGRKGKNKQRSFAARRSRPQTGRMSPRALRS